ncbi:MAG: iron ABC transporter permease [Flavobacteriales bacterium]
MTISKKIIGLLILLLGLSFLGIALGSVLVPFEEQFDLIFNLRTSRTVTAIIAGAGISVAGLLMQTLFRNPLAGPSVLGISSGSTLGVALGIFAINLFGISSFDQKMSISILAILGAMAVTFLLLFVSKFLKKSNTLLIVGLMVGYFVSSVVNVFSFYGDKTNLQSFVYWGFGSFSKEINFEVLWYYFTPILVLIFLIFLIQKQLNLLLMGEKYAVSMGLDYKKTRLLIILIVGLLVGIITALCGPIAFLGIATPHLARNFIKKSDHRFVIPFTLLMGACLGLICDIISRLPGLDGSLPLNAVTSFIGAPIVVWIIFKNKMA